MHTNRCCDKRRREHATVQIHIGKAQVSGERGESVPTNFKARPCD